MRNLKSYRLWSAPLAFAVLLFAGTASATDDSNLPKNPATDAQFLGEGIDAYVGLFSNYYGLVTAAVDLVDLFLGGRSDITGLLEQMRTDIITELRSERDDQLTWTAQSITQNFEDILLNPSTYSDRQTSIQLVTQLKDQANDVRVNMYGIMNAGSPTEIYRFAPHFIALTAVEISMLKFLGAPYEELFERFQESIDVEYRAIRAKHGSCATPMTVGSSYSDYPNESAGEGALFGYLVRDHTSYTYGVSGCGGYADCEYSLNSCDCVQYPYEAPDDTDYSYCLDYAQTCALGEHRWFGEFDADPVVQLIRGDMTTILLQNGSMTTSDTGVDLDYRVNSDLGLDIENQNCGFTWQPVGDWAVGSDKAQCEREEAVIGISEATNRTSVHEVQCSAPSATTGLYPQNSSCHSLLFDPGDNQPNAPDGDWDPHFYKAECARNEFVAGVSRSGDGKLNGILCCAGGVHHNACDNQAIDSGDSSAYAKPDWDPHHYKAQCPASQYVAGVSAYTASRGVAGSLHAIRCCTP